MAACRAAACAASEARLARSREDAEARSAKSLDDVDALSHAVDAVEEARSLTDSHNEVVEEDEVFDGSPLFGVGDSDM